MKKTFEQWMAEINRQLDVIGVTVDDLPDCPYHDWYDDGVTAKNAAKRALKIANE